MAVIWGGPDERAEVLAGIAAALDRDPERMEIDCRLPDEVVAVMRSAGVFRMPMPVAWGGPELPMGELLEAIEELSYVEGAVGWCAMIGCDAAFYSAWLDDDVGRALFEDLDSITAGWVMPAGSATPTEGGYRLSGTWSFGSGSTHADWFCNGALVADTLEWRLMFVPAADVDVVAGTWDTTGLRGTGSFDYRVDDAFVPGERTFSLQERPKRAGSLYSHPATFAIKAGAVPIGLARRALDEVRVLAETKLVAPQLVPLRELVSTQTAFARADALVAAHRCWFYDSVRRLMDATGRGELPTDEVRRNLFLSTAAAVHACRDAVELLAEVAGTDSIRRSNRLERIRRDLVTAATHVVARGWEPCGRSALGLDPGHPLF